MLSYFWCISIKKTWQKKPKTSRPSVKLIIRNHSVPDLWICIPLKKETIFSSPLYLSCGVSSVLFHNTSYTLQCTSAHSTHHINTPLYPLLRAGIQLQTRCGDGEKAATGLLRLLITSYWAQINESHS